MTGWPKTKRKALGLGRERWPNGTLGPVVEGALVGTMEWAVSQPHAC